MQERKEWAERQREDSEKRMAEMKAQRERVKQEQDAAKEKRAKETAMVAEMLREMYRLNPELAARRQGVLQRKAERERAAMHNQLQSIRS